MFEILKSDLAGRIGILQTNHGKVETPAYVPVIHPVRQTIPPNKIRKIGFDLVITNAYLTKKNFNQEAVKRGIHDIIKFDGAVMTDSGGYQVLEYGDLDVLPQDIAKFETDIGSDIAIPLDKPTGYGLPKSKARSYVEHTLKVSKQAIDQINSRDRIWVGPIQGGEHLDLVKKSTNALVDYGFPMLALGSPVEFMESYQYRLLAEMIVSAKKHIPPSIPLHLFGAGHPLTIPLAVALGCDTFDSASYILYAKQDRYISEDRTWHLADILYFSCPCEVCSSFTPKEMRNLKKEDRIDVIALHNLFAIKSEVERVKQAIFEGRLWEYVIKKARAHPKLFETIDVITKNSSNFIHSTPKFKDRALFLFSKEDQFRPEIISYHNMVRRFRTKKKSLVITSDASKNPYFLSYEYGKLKKKFPNDSVQFCLCNPFLGIIPLELSDIYPAAHYVMVKSDYSSDEFSLFEKTWNIFFGNNDFKTVYYQKDDCFLKIFVKTLPKSVRKKRL